MPRKKAESKDVKKPSAKQTKQKKQQAVAQIEDTLQTIEIPQDIQDQVPFSKEERDFFELYVIEKDEEKVAHKLGWSVKKLNKKLKEDHFKAFYLDIQKGFKAEMMMNNVFATQKLLQVQKKLEDAFDNGASCGPALVKTVELQMKGSGQFNQESGQKPVQINVQINNKQNTGTKVFEIPDATDDD